MSARSQVPPGKTWYWAGVNQPGSDLLGDLVGRDDGGRHSIASDVRGLQPSPTSRPRCRSSMASSKRTSVGLLATMLLDGNEKLTFVEGSVRRSIGPALVEAAVARDSKGGMAARAQAVAQIGAINVSAEALIADNFIIEGRARRPLSRRAPVARRTAQDRPAAVSSARRRPLDRSRAGRRALMNAAGRLSTNFNGFNLSSLRQLAAAGSAAATARPTSSKPG